MSELRGLLEEARALLPAAIALRRRIHAKAELGLDLPLTRRCSMSCARSTSRLPAGRRPPA